MSISRAERSAYEAGQAEHDLISNYSLTYLLSGGHHQEPEDPTLKAAYDKGLRGEQLDS
jgi:hypothetical protein